MSALGALLLGGALIGIQAAPAPRASEPSELDWTAFRIFDSNAGLPQNTVLAIDQDAAGFVYVGTERGLARYDGRAFENVPLGDIGALPVGALASGEDGALWIGTDGAGVWRSRGGAPEAVTSAAPRVHRLLAGPQEMWVASDSGLLRCPYVRGAPGGEAPAAAPCVLLEATRGIGIRSVLAAGEDALWIGTNGEGLRRLVDVRKAARLDDFHLDRDDGLPNSIVISLGAWRDDLWIGAGRGFARLRGEQLDVWSAANGLVSSMAFGFAADEQRLLVALRPGGLASIDAADRWRTLRGAHGLPEDNIQVLFRERIAGHLWIGTYGGGIAREEPGRFALFDQRRGLPDRAVVGLGLLDDRLWVGTANGAVVWRDGAFVPMLPPELGVRQVRAALRTPDGDLFVASDRGLLRLRDDNLLDQFTVDNSALPAVWANDLTYTDEGAVVWVATGHGLARWTPHSGLKRVVGDVDVPLADAGVSAFASDGRERFAVATSDGVWFRRGDDFAKAPDRCIAQLTINDMAFDGERVLIAAREGLISWTPGAGCSAVPDTPADNGWSHVRPRQGGLVASGVDGLWIVDGRGARRFGLEDGLPVRELARGNTLAVDRAGRIFAGTNLGVGALRDVAEAPTSPAPLQLSATLAGGATLEPGATLPLQSASVHFRYRLLSLDREHRHRYTHQLIGIDTAPHQRSEAEVDYVRLPPGDYRFEVSAVDANGVRSKPLSLDFQVAAPWWQRWPALAGGGLALVLGGALLGRWRLRALKRRAALLQAQVAERTQELADANRRLSEAALTDPLTGLRNRRYLAQIEHDECERTRRRTRAGDAHADLIVVLLDLDHFKQINDNFGHPAGDAVLQAAAKRLAGVARAGDAVLRWGGEEFLMLLRDSDRRALTEIAHRVLAAVHGDVAFDGQQIGVHASAGIVAFPLYGRAEASLSDAIARADEALYAAKRAGRDGAMVVQNDETIWIKRPWTDNSSSI